MASATETRIPLFRSRFVNSMIFFCIFGDLMKGWV
jgi:hypothetical protein